MYFSNYNRVETGLIRLEFDWLIVYYKQLNIEENSPVVDWFKAGHTRCCHTFFILFLLGTPMVI